MTGWKHGRETTSIFLFKKNAEVICHRAFAAWNVIVDGGVEDHRFPIRAFDHHGGGTASIQAQRVEDAEIFH